MQPHFVRDYIRETKAFSERFDHDEAMANAVGGSFDSVGKAERKVLDFLGLKDGDSVVDVGCGSGRLATQLRDLPRLRYLGIDVVPDLLDYARNKCQRIDWNFQQVDGLAIPAPDQSADVVTFFSVLTHLSRSEGMAYVADAVRVMKPDGQIVVSFLDLGETRPMYLLRIALAQVRWRLMRVGVRNAFSTKTAMKRLGERLGLSATFIGTSWLGQNIVVYRRA